jgi:integrase
MLKLTMGSVTFVSVTDKSKAGGKCKAKSCRDRKHRHYRIAFSYDCGTGRVQKTGHRFRTKSEGEEALADWRGACKADPLLLGLSYGDWRAGVSPRVESQVQGAEQPFRVWAALWLAGKDHRATTAEAAAKYLLGKPRWDSPQDPGVCVAEAHVRDGRARFGDLPLKEIDWRDVRDVIRAEAAHREGGHNRTYSLRGWSYLGPCLRAAAVEYDLDPRIGNRDYAKPPTAKDVRNMDAKRRRDRGITEEIRLPWQQWTLDNATFTYQYVAKHHGAQWVAILRMALGVGMRRAEVCGLRWRDIDWKRHVVVIRTSRSESSNGTIEENDPKNGKAREVDLGSREYDALAAWAEEQAALLGTDVAQADGYVFTGDRGLPWRPKTLSDVCWRNITRELAGVGVPGPVSFHALRKISGAFGLSYWGEDLYAVAQRLGHSDIKVTQSHYAYITTDRGRSLAAARDAA